MTAGPNGIVEKQPVKDHSLLHKENNLNFGSKIKVEGDSRIHCYLGSDFPNIRDNYSIQQEAKL